MINYTEADTQKCSEKKVFLKISQNSQENTGVGVSFWSSLVAGLQTATSLKATPTQMFSCKF